MLHRPTNTFVPKGTRSPESRNLVWNPHLHCIVSRGVWRADGQWIPVPYIDTHAAEILFREKLFRLL